MKTDIMDLIDKNITGSQLTEETAYDYIFSKIDIILANLKHITKLDTENYNLTDIAVIAMLCGVNKHDAYTNKENKIYKYIKHNWKYLQSIGCVKRVKYILSFRGVYHILVNNDYDFDKPITLISSQENTNIIPNTTNNKEVDFDKIIDHKRRELTDKLIKLTDEYTYRGEQLEKLKKAIEALDLLKNIDTFVIL